MSNSIKELAVDRMNARITVAIFDTQPGTPERKAAIKRAVDEYSKAIK